jgi:hypothetical protein
MGTAGGLGNVYSQGLNGHQCLDVHVMAVSGVSVLMGTAGGLENVHSEGGSGPHLLDLHRCA